MRYGHYGGAHDYGGARGDAHRSSQGREQEVDQPAKKAPRVFVVREKFRYDRPSTFFKL